MDRRFSLSRPTSLSSSQDTMSPVVGNLSFSSVSSQGSEDGAALQRSRPDSNGSVFSDNDRTSASIALEMISSQLKGMTTGTYRASEDISSTAAQHAPHHHTTAIKTGIVLCPTSYVYIQILLMPNPCR